MRRPIWIDATDRMVASETPRMPTVVATLVTTVISTVRTIRQTIGRGGLGISFSQLLIEFIESSVEFAEVVHQSSIFPNMTIGRCGTVGLSGE